MTYNIYEFEQDLRSEVEDYIRDSFAGSYDSEYFDIEDETAEEFADDLIDNLYDNFFCEVVENLLPVYDGDLLDVLASKMSLGYINAYNSLADPDSVFDIIMHNLRIYGEEYIDANLTNWCIDIWYEESSKLNE